MKCKECESHGWGTGHCVNPAEHAPLQSIQETAPPAGEPTALSPEMLGEEDRAHLWNLRRLAMRYETPMTGKLDPPCVVWADRLLGSTDKGGEW